LGCADAAAALNARIGAELDALRAQLAGVAPRKTLIITSRETHDLNSIYTAGRGSFVSELVEVAGGVNLFADRAQNYFEASKEEVLERAPEVILEFHCGRGLTQNQRQAFYNDWNAMGTLPAVRNGRIYFITMSHGLRPGPRIAEVARAIAAELHPETVTGAME
jgi:iron complex transport system substrate-binding protein